MRQFRKTTYERVLRCIWETNATANSLIVSLGGTTCRVESLVPTTLARAVFHTKRTYVNTIEPKVLYSRYLNIALRGRASASPLEWPIVGCRHCKANLTFSSSAREFSGQQELRTQRSFYSTSNAFSENNVAEAESRVEKQMSDESVQDKQSITLTSGAIAKLKDLRQKKGGIDLRLQVDGGGCSGFQYVFKLDAEGPKEDDVVIDAEGVRLLCDSVSMEFLGGCTVDYESDLMRSGFVVRLIFVPISNNDVSMVMREYKSINVHMLVCFV